MSGFTEQQFIIFKQIAQLSQHNLRLFLINYLQKYYSENQIFYSKEYIYAIGDIPIALIAHLDTVHKRKPINFFYDKEQDVLWSPQGLGADDRAGVFGIMNILGSGLRPNIIFTTDEERGGIGASKLAEKENPFKDLRYIIELDHCGINDCVFYECDNQYFTEYIETFGFKTTQGIYSDISEICPDWGIAGVNLSVGYFYEHSFAEYLIPSILMNNLNIVKQMLTQTKIPYFKYIPNINNGGRRIWQHEGQ